MDTLPNAERDRLAGALFHTLRAEAKREREANRQLSPGEERSRRLMDRAVAVWVERERDARRANWFAAYDAYERQWD